MSVNLLASNGWILDVAVLIILIFGMFFGIKRGFIGGICKIGGTLFALIFAFFFCVSFENFLESAFGMTSAISNGLVAKFSENETLSVELSGIFSEESLAAVLPGFIAKILAGALSGQEIPAGTTGATLLGPLVAKWIAVLISFVLLIILIKLACFIIGKIGSGIVDSVGPLRVVNKLLGGLLGLLKSLLFVFILLAICGWLPIESLHEFISSSAIIGKIYGSAWFESATSYVFSFEWLKEYIAGQSAVA